MTNKTLIKEISLGLMTLIIAIFFWLAVFAAFQMEFAFDTLSLVGWSSLVYSLLAFCLLLTFLGIFGTLVRNKMVVYLTVFLVAVVPFFFFIKGYYSLFIIVSCTMMFWFYTKYCRDETDGRYKFSIVRSTYFGLPLVVIVLLIALSLSYYVAMTHDDEDGTKLKDSINTIVLNSLNKVMESRMEDYDPNMALDDWLGNLQIQEVFSTLPEFLGPEVISEDLKNEIEQSAEYQEALSEAEEQAKAEVIVSLRNEFLKQFEIEAEGSDPISEVLTKWVDQTIGDFVTPYTKFIPPVLAISLFLVLRLLTPIYIAIARFFQWIIFSLLLKSGFIHIKKEKKEVEIVGL
ncbi:MAG: hypothetical protein ABIB97_00525 [Patescibacteria group bacterium]